MKRFFSFVLTIIMVFAFFSSVPVLVEATDTSMFAGGSGTEADPYLIGTKEHLNNVRKDLNAHYKMIADIVFTESDFAVGGDFYNEGKGWVPIGTDSSNAFQGTFDGATYSINGLQINILSSGITYAGLFGFTYNAKINNTVLVNADIYVNGSYACIGGIAGYTMYTRFDGCRSSGTIESSDDAGGIVGYIQGGIITNCHNSATVLSSHTAGGIVGASDVVVSNCSNTGSISSIDGSISGGIVGYLYLDGSIYNCYNTGDIFAIENRSMQGSPTTYAGGICGEANDSSIRNCFNLGTIRAEDVSRYAFAGGIAGTANIYNCYNIGNVSSSASATYYAVAGGVVGDFDKVTENCYYLNTNNKGAGRGTDSSVKCSLEELLLPTTYDEFDFETIWEFAEGNYYTYPTLIDVEYFIVNETSTFNAGLGTEESPYCIASPKQLDNVRYYLGSHFKLVRDILFNETDFTEGGMFYNGGAGWIPIGTDYDSPFTGYFDGNNHKISNLHINITQVPENGQVFAGLFGYGNGCQISNLSLKNLDITVDVNDAAVSVGAILGRTDEFGTGAIITNCTNDGKIYASIGNVGGIAGSFEKGTLKQCENYGIVGTTTGSAGGIISYLNNGEIIECQNFSIVGGENVYGDCGGIVANSWGNIVSCVNFGDITSEYNAAGIACSNWGLVDNCINNGDINAKYSVGGIATVSAAMQNSNTSCGVINCINKGNIVAGVKSDDMYSISAGGIAGSIQNGITVLNSWNYGEVSTVSETMDCSSGGIVGQNKGGSVIKCGNSGDIIVETTRYACGGGIVGSNGGYYMDAFIDQCFNSGMILAPVGTNGICGGISGFNYDDTVITNCFNIGSIKSSGRPGGIVGLLYNDNSSVEQCYNTGFLTTLTPNSWIVGDETPNITNCFYLDIPLRSAQEIVGYGAGIGISPEEMGNFEVFTGFDFDSIWTMAGNKEYLYPELRELPLVYTKEIVGIAISKVPEKTEYLENIDIIDTSGGKLLVYYNGMCEIIDINNSMITGFNNTIIGQQTVFVEYNGFFDEFDIMIKCNSHTYDNDCDVLCNDCGEKREINHTAVKDPAVAATCTAAGKTEGSHCSICNTVIMKQTTVPAKGHTSSDWIFDEYVTCTTGGSKHKECTVCGEVLETVTYPATGHTTGHWIVDLQPTASTPGSQHKECIDCGKVVETETIPQLKPATPKVATTNEIGGVQVTWNKVAGATKYVVFRRQGGYSTWVNVGTTTGNTLLDKNVKSGIFYVYSVRAYNSAGKYSDFVSANTNTRKYMATPKLTTIYNHQNGLAIKWNAVDGITKGYRVYRRGAGSTYWTYLGTTKNLYFIDNAVKNKSGEYFRYTVIADGGYHSKFDTTGLYLRRLANPTLTSAVSSSAGITVKWSAVKGTTGYYVYRKTANSTWTRVGTVGGTNNTTFLDKTAKKGTTYTYTVKAVCGATTSAYYSGISCKDKY